MIRGAVSSLAPRPAPAAFCHGYGRRVEELERALAEAARVRDVVREAHLAEVGALRAALKTAEEAAALLRIARAEVAVYRLGHDRAVAETKTLRARLAALESASGKDSSS